MMWIRGPPIARSETVAAHYRWRGTALAAVDRPSVWGQNLDVVFDAGYAFNVLYTPAASD